MVVDTSALAAILLGESDADLLLDALSASEQPVVSAATLLEASIVLDVRLGGEGVRLLDELLATARARVVAVDESQAAAALDAYRRFGRGRHPAALNYGDCFAYALASTTGRALLFKGEDFARTDIADARHT